MISKRWTIATALSVLLISTLMVPPVQSHGLRLKKLLIGYVIAKAIKPRFVPIPLPLPFPLKIGKDKHVSHPVYSHSTSAHAEMVHDPWQGAGGYGGGGGGGYGGGGGGGGMGMGGGWY